MLDIQEIKRVLPHRFPFLLVDRILEIEEGKRGKGLKNVTCNEMQFLGHFPDLPIMPGVLIVEAMAQLGAVVILHGRKGKKITPYLTGVNRLKLRKPVTPGDQLILEAECLGIKGSLGKMWATARVDGVLVAEGEIMFAIREEKEPSGGDSAAES